MKVKLSGTQQQIQKQKLEKSASSDTPVMDLLGMTFTEIEEYVDSTDQTELLKQLAKALLVVHSKQ